MQTLSLMAGVRARICQRHSTPAVFEAFSRCVFHNHQDVKHVLNSAGHLEQAAYIVLVVLIRDKALFLIAGSLQFVVALSCMLVSISSWSQLDDGGVLGRQSALLVAFHNHFGSSTTTNYCQLFSQGHALPWPAELAQPRLGLRPREGQPQAPLMQGGNLEAGSRRSRQSASEPHLFEQAAGQDASARSRPASAHGQRWLDAFPIPVGPSRHGER